MKICTEDIVLTKLLANAQGSYNWSRLPSPDVSYVEHKQTFNDAIIDAALTIKNNGGSLNVMIIGRDATFIQTLPGFEKSKNSSDTGPNIWGYRDGITFINALDNHILPDNKIICLFKHPKDELTWDVFNTIEAKYINTITII